MKKIIAILLLILAISITSCHNEEGIKDPNEIILRASDEINLTAGYYETNSGDHAVLLLHMLGKDRHDYDMLLPIIMQNSYSVLALDFRGHGNSDLEYTIFSESDWQNLVLDVEEGVDFLDARGYKKITVIGASIGANAALKQAVQDKRIDNLILISAGEDYHGLKTLDYAQFYSKPIVIVAAMDDKDAAVAATKIYNAVQTENKELKMYQTGGHGTALLTSQEGFSAMIGTWLKKWY